MALAPWKRYSLLSFDGGGIRGYASLLILERLMKYIGEAEMQAGFESSFSPYELPKKLANYPAHQENIARRFLPCHYFDTVIGTSTGGLIAIMLARLRMTAPDARKQYEDLGEKIFGNNLRTLWRPLSYLQNRYSHNAAQEAFQQVTVEHDKGLDEVHGFVNAPFNRMDYGVCKTIVTALGTVYHPSKGLITRTIGNNPSEMLLFQTYNSPFHGGLGRSVAKRAFRGPVWTVARACTAAPTYFDPVEIQALDGRIWRFEDAGLQVNNPTEVGIEEVKSWNQNPKSNDVVHAVVSIGTGEKHSSMFASNRSIFPFNEARALGQGILDGSLETTSVDNRVRDQLRQDGEDRKYWRFNDDSIEWEDIKLDDYRSDALRNMEYLISRYMEEHKVQKDMKSCAGRLVKQRHERIRTSKAKWERFADATEFICNVPGCFIRYNMADDSESHFEKHHQGCEKKVRRLRWTYK